MTKKQRIEALEKEVKRLNFIIKNGGENKTAIKKTIRPLVWGCYLDVSYINPKDSEIKTLIICCCDCEATSSIYKDTEYEAIIKVKNHGVEWYKLDKKDNILIKIPEPAEFAEKTVYVRDELTKDDKLEPSDKTMEELLAGSVGMKRPTDEVKSDDHKTCN